MSDEKKPVPAPSPKRGRVMFKRDGVHGEADSDGRTRKHAMGDVAEFDDAMVKTFVDRGWAISVGADTPLTPAKASSGPFVDEPRQAKPREARG